MRAFYRAVRCAVERHRGRGAGGGAVPPAAQKDDAGLEVNESAFDIVQILNNREAFVEHVKQLLLVPVEPTYSNFSQWQSNVPPVSKKPDGAAYRIVAGEKSAKLDKLIYRILSVAEEQQLTLGDILGAFKPEMRERLLAYFKDLGANGLLAFNDPLRPKRAARESVTDSAGAPLEAAQVSAAGALD